MLNATLNTICTPDWFWLSIHSNSCIINTETILWKNCKSKKLSVFSDNEIRECEGVVEMIKELSKGINGFNEDELLEILAYISST